MVYIKAYNKAFLKCDYFSTILKLSNLFKRSNWINLNLSMRA